MAVCDNTVYDPPERDFAIIWGDDETEHDGFGREAPACDLAGGAAGGGMHDRARPPADGPGGRLRAIREVDRRCREGGMLAPITSPTAANPDQGEAFKAAVAAFNKRGGLGPNGTRMEAVVCDTKGDANGEVELRPQAGQRGRRRHRQRPRVQQPGGRRRGAAERRGSTDRARFDRGRHDKPVVPVVHRDRRCLHGRCGGASRTGERPRSCSSGPTPRPAPASPTSCARTSSRPASTSSVTSRSRQAPPTTRHTSRRSSAPDPDAVLFAIDDTAAAQLIAAWQQLNYKPLLGGHPGTFTLETLQKFKDNTTGTLLAESFPYPSQSNVKTFPALKQFFADMKASKQEILDPNNIQPTSLYPWVSTLALRQRDEGRRRTVTKDSVIQALKTGQDIDLMGLAEPWTPSAPGIQRLRAGSRTRTSTSRSSTARTSSPRSSRSTSANTSSERGAMADRDVSSEEPYGGSGP